MWKARGAGHMAGAEKLSAVKVAKLKGPGRFGDGRGLWLHLGKDGGRSWVFRYTRQGRAREMGLGPTHAVSLADARELARLARRQIIVDGIDPLDARNQQRTKNRIEAARGITFEDAAAQYIAAHEPSWKSQPHRDQWKTTLRDFAHPIAGKLPVAAVDTAIVLKMLEPIWSVKPETAARVRGRVESILDWATARGYRQGNNPATWRGHLDKLLPAKARIRAVKHHAAMPYDALPIFMDQQLRTLDSITARALEFLILTAARSGEVINAVWDEIDLAKAVWAIPAARMKAGREHRVPLSERACEILRSLPREGKFVFPGNKANRPLIRKAMADLLKAKDGPGNTIHGFRSSFRTWASERTNFPGEIAEAALAHVLKNKTEAAYLRGDALEKRRRLMADWSRFCGTPGAGDNAVIPIGRANG